MLTGLIIACEDVADGAGLRAELPIAGQTLLEQQVRLLADAGARRVIVIARHLPQGLAAAVNRLRRDRISVEIVRQADEVAQRIQPEEPVIVLADGIVTDSTALDRLTGAASPAILTLPDIEGTRDWELIDASARWAGVLLVDGDLVRRTARMLGDWDLQSTLLRNAIQAGAERIDLGAAAVPMLALVHDSADAMAVETAILRCATRRHRGLADRYLLDPLSRLLAPRAMAAMIDPLWLRIGAFALTLLAALSLVVGWRGPGLALALAAGPVDALGRNLAALTMRLRRDHRRWAAARAIAAGAALLALGWALRDLGWGTIAVAATTIGVMTALIEHERLIGRPARRPIWIADADTLVWLLVPFALAGWWTGGLVAQAIWAFGSLLTVQRLTRR